MPISQHQRLAIVLGFVTVYSAVVHYRSLNQSAFATGWDSYFYLVQVKSYLEEGQMVSSRISLFYPFLMGVKALVGNYVIAWKVAGSILCALFGLLCYFLLRSLQQKRSVALLGFTLAVCSPQLFFFSAQYLKNLMGFDLVLLFLILLLRKKMLLALGVLLLCLFTHKAALAFGGLFFLVYSIIRWKRHQLLWLLAGITALLIASITVPLVFSLGDLMRDSNLLSHQLHFSYASFIFNSGLHVSSLWAFELILSLVCIPIFWMLHKKSNTEFWIALLSLQITWLLFNLPIWSMDRLGYGFRFFLQSALLAPVFIAICTSRVQGSKWLHFVSILILGLAILTAKTYKPKYHDPPYVKYNAIQHRLTQHPNYEQTALYIAHKGLAEYIKFASGKDAMAWVPEYDIPPEKLYRVVKTKDFSFLYNTTSDGNKAAWYRLSSLYYAVPEHIWQGVYKSLPHSNPELYEDLSDWTNPNRMRPEYMKKYRVK